MGPRLITGTPEIAQAFIIVGAVILVAATFIDINIGLIAILMSMLLSPELEVGAAAERAITIRADDLILILVSIAWLAKMAIKKSPLVRRSPLNVPIALYVAIMCFSTVRGIFLGDITLLKGAFYVLKLSEYFILYFIVINHTTSEKQVKIFLAILLLTALIVGIYGNTHLGGGERISAPFEGKGEPNTLGGYLLFILSILGGLIYCYREKRPWLISLFIFLVPTFIFTLSRASYLGAIPAVITFVILAKDRRVFIGVLIISLFTVLFVLFGPPVLKDRIMDTFEPSRYEKLQFELAGIKLGSSPADRVLTWKSSIRKYFSKSPFLGEGVTGVGFLDGQYILILLETGVVGLGIFLWLLYRVWRAALYSFKMLEKPLFRGLVMGYIVGFVGLLFHAIGSNTFVIIRIAEPFWFFTAIVDKLSDIETGKAVMVDQLPEHLRRKF